MAENSRRDEANTTPLAYEDADVVSKLSWQVIRFSPLLAVYLLPFEFLNAPRWFPVIGHAFMSLGAVLFLFNTLREYISVRSSAFVSYLEYTFGTSRLSAQSRWPGF